MVATGTVTTRCPVLALEGGTDETLGALMDGMPADGNSEGSIRAERGGGFCLCLGTIFGELGVAVLVVAVLGVVAVMGNFFFFNKLL